jgi:hypothetical protein
MLREAASDLRFLLGRGYARPGALDLVGNKFQLVKRQRQVLARAVNAPEVSARIRAATAAGARRLDVVVDGYNALITAETALAGGLLVRGDDAFLRDAREAHGSYRTHAGTEPALLALLAALRAMEPRSFTFYLDRPMHNAGRLAVRLRELGAAAEVVDSADRALKAAADAPEAVLATSDSALLSSGRRGFDLPARAIAQAEVQAWIVEL